jgi:isopenicillin-N epimerase
MEVDSPSDAVRAPDAALREMIDSQFPPMENGVTYLNTGSSGRKPTCVLDALNQGLKQINRNPTIATFIDETPINNARKAAGTLFNCPPSSLLMTGNSTQGLQLILESFLTKPGDELVTTDHEHGSARTVMRYLEETRGVVIRKYETPKNCSSEQFCFGLLSFVSDRTKLVLVSEIDCFTGWRPDLTTLVDSLELLDVPLLVDGAHAPGHINVRPSKYPMWVGSGHKWLGGPNGTGFTYVSQELIPRLEPVWLGDQFYEKRDQDIYDLTRFECRGTSDVCQWYGLTAAIELHQTLNANHVQNYQRALASLLQEKLSERFPVEFRTPSKEQVPAEELTALVTFNFPEDRVKVKNLRDALWTDHKIWTQPDNLNANPGHGMRISCHYTVTVDDLDKLINALSNYVG